MGTYLSRDAILQATSLPSEETEVPEWGGTVLVRGLNGQGRDEFEASTMVVRNGKAYPDTANVRAKLVARCVIDHDTGEPMFTQSDVHALGQLSGAALDRVFTVASRLSGLSEADVAELEGNSPAAPGGDSSSSSSATSGVSPSMSSSPGSPAAS